METNTQPVANNDNNNVETNVSTDVNNGGSPTENNKSASTATGNEPNNPTDAGTQAQAEQTKNVILPPEENKPSEEVKNVEAPTQYEPFNVPEGFDAPMDDFKTWALGAGLTQKQAQGAVDFYCKTIIPQMAQKQEEVIKQWKTQTNAQLGSQGVSQAMKALDRLADSNKLLKPFLQDSGLINHPVITGLLCDLSLHLLEGTAGTPYNVNTPMAQRTLAQALFPNSLK